MTIGRPGSPEGFLPKIKNPDSGGEKTGKSLGIKKGNGPKRVRDGYSRVDDLPSIDDIRERLTLLPSINPSSTNKRVERMIKRYSNQDPARQKQCFKEMENDNFSPEERQAVLKALRLSKENNFVDSLRKRVGSNSSDGETTGPSEDTSRLGSPSSDSPGSDPLILKDFEDAFDPNDP